MIEGTVAYPAGQGRTFNMDSYLKTHIPLFQKRMGAAMKTIRVSRGIGGSPPTSPAAFVAMVHATFDSAEVFATAFAPHACLHACAALAKLPCASPVVRTPQLYWVGALLRAEGSLQKLTPHTREGSIATDN